MKSEPYKTTVIEYRGFKIAFNWHYDEYAELPWQFCDCYGVVSEWSRRDKKPNEMLLHISNGYNRFYDFKESVKSFKRQGYDGKQANDIALDAFKHLQKFCRDQWFYLTCETQVTDSNGNEVKFLCDNVSMIESDSLCDYETDQLTFLKKAIDKEINEQFKAGCSDVLTLAV